MTFEGQYLTYAEYQQLGGSAIGKMPFNLLEYEARKQIDIRTLNRLKDLEDIPEEVQLCEKKLIDTLIAYDNTSNNISSNGNKINESIDGYSVGYLSTKDTAEIIKSKNKEVDDIISNYLYGVIVNGEHIIYCGVR